MPKIQIKLLILELSDLVLHGLDFHGKTNMVSCHKFYGSFYRLSVIGFIVYCLLLEIYFFK